jgi:molybdopterin synthase catalytic subunit
MMLVPPGKGDDWVALCRAVLPAGAAADWAALPRCGGVVTFTGMVRDHSDGRPGVVGLEYEAYDEEVQPRLNRVVAEARARWPSLGRVAVLHRVGRLQVSEVSVVVVVSAPRRAEAFDAARFCIDTVKRTVPIWKRETWDGGDEWALDAHPVEELSQ